MGRHGGNQVRLTRNDVSDGSPEWSPDGTHIAWVRYATKFGGASDIWVMDPDGSNQRNLTGDASEELRDPAWSPDGTRIAFVRSSRIWVMDADGSGAHQIGPSTTWGVAPAWSPDGSRIAYVSSGSTGTEIFVMDADGSHPQQLTSTESVDETDPAWSPDGSRIAYSGYHWRGSWHVDMMRSDGVGGHVVIDEYSLDPTWSPDGSKIAFYACAEGQCRIFQSSWRGRHLRVLGRSNGVHGAQPDFRETIPAI